MEGKMEQEIKKEEKPENTMRKIRIEKVVLSIGGTGDYLDKGVKLLEILTNRKPSRRKAGPGRRIPSFGVRPGLELGAVVTLRKNTDEFLRRLLESVNNNLKKSQISENNFSFGISEYIEIPGIEYNREIGIMGLDVTVVFKRAGKRVALKKINRGKYSKKQKISREEIIKFMEENFETSFD